MLLPFRKGFIVEVSHYHYLVHMSLSLVQDRPPPTSVEGRAAPHRGVDSPPLRGIPVAGGNNVPDLNYRFRHHTLLRLRHRVSPP